jgi:3-deoxy-manno-octulosonate cytidylyltransferase (CMP-KDO synthetase)
LIDICGKPMIWWVYQQAIKVVEFSDVVVATDDARIAEACREHNMNFLLTAENQAANERLYEVSKKIAADIYVCVNGDEPLISTEAIRSVLPKDSDDLDLYYAIMQTP